MQIFCSTSSTFAVQSILSRCAWRALESTPTCCLCAWHSLSILEYVVGKVFGRTERHKILREMLCSWIVPSTGTEEAQDAFLQLSGDYEDALQIASAVAGRADYLATRDKKGYEKCPINVLGPEELCEILERSG